MDGAPGAGRIDVSAQCDDAAHVRIVVRDTGLGISAARRASLLEPFVSGKPTGMGLGLAVSRAIAGSSRRLARCDARRPRNSTWCCRWKRRMPERGSLVVYVVDDDAAIRDSLA